jgi:hypothetical protein
MINILQTITCDICGVTNNIKDMVDFYGKHIAKVTDITVLRKTASSDGAALDEKDWYFEELKLHLCKKCTDEVVVLENWGAQGILKLKFRFKKNAEE